jgi:hypothetical protein
MREFMGFPVWVFRLNVYITMILVLGFNAVGIDTISKHWNLPRIKISLIQEK